MKAAIRILAAIQINKPYKPRKIKMDQVHRLARQLYKVKKNQPGFKAAQKKYRKQYLRKNKRALERRAEFVHKARERMGLDKE